MIARCSLTVAFFVAAAHVNAQKRWLEMDYGPYLSATISGSNPAENTALKGLGIRLAEGRAGVAFDTELLRMASAWTGGWLELRGTAYDGSHGPMPSIGGRELAATRQRPGWAMDASFDDPRRIPHGPLPRAWGRYRGLYLHGKQVIVSYDVRGVGILESYRHIDCNGNKGIIRSIEIAPHDAPLKLAAADAIAARSSIRGNVIWTETEPRTPGFVTVDRSEGRWRDLWIGAPSERDFADQSRKNGVRARWVEGFAKPHASAGAKGQDLPRLLDGDFARHADDTERSVWFDSGKARIEVDLGKSIELGRVHVYSRHKSDRAPLRVTLWGHAETTGDASAKRLPKTGWKRIGRADTRALGQGGSHGVAFGNADSSAFGQYAKLLLVLDKPSSNGSFLSEIDVWRAGQDAVPTIKTRPPIASAVAIAGKRDGMRWSHADGRTSVLEISPSTKTRRVSLVYWRGEAGDAASKTVALMVDECPPVPDLGALTKGGPRRHPETITTKGRLGKGRGPWVVDTITVPKSNPWKSWLRFGAFDFFKDGRRAALSTWNGDVWIVDGIDGDLDELRWTRFATGLYDPLGLKIVDDVIYAHGRDQITRLHDLNNDGEADFYECFNNDVLITKGFHEFAFDLHTDKHGDFWFAKGGPVNPGGRGFQKIVPHHGTILKLSKNGKKLEVWATGLRAPNGIGVGPNGEITSGDNEGTWMPRCRLNYITKKGAFCGCVATSHQTPLPTSYDKPLCWLPFSVDNSSGSQVWTIDERWGLPANELLHLSYGQCHVFRVLKETVNGQVQGGITRIPVSFASSAMRARFHPGDGQLYVCGFKGWQTRAARDTAFQRVRYTGKPVQLASGLHATKRGIYVSFACELDPETANDPESFSVEQWNYKWSQAYGSPEISASDPKKVDKNKGSHNKVPDERTARDVVEVRSAKLQADGRTVFLEIPKIRPVMQMRIGFSLDAKNGRAVRGQIHSSVHELADSWSSQR